MSITKAEKNLIDGMTYEELLTRWRFSKSPDPLFQWETGRYYSDVMAKKKDEVGEAVAVAISKRIGWRS